MQLIKMKLSQQPSFQSVKIKPEKLIYVTLSLLDCNDKKKPFELSKGFILIESINIPIIFLWTICYTSLCF